MNDARRKDLERKLLMEFDGWLLDQVAELGPECFDGMPDDDVLEEFHEGCQEEAMFASLDRLRGSDAR